MCQRIGKGGSDKHIFRIRTFPGDFFQKTFRFLPVLSARTPVVHSKAQQNQIRLMGNRPFPGIFQSPFRIRPAHGGIDKFHASAIIIPQAVNQQFGPLRLSRFQSIKSAAVTAAGYAVTVKDNFYRLLPFQPAVQPWRRSIPDTGRKPCHCSCVV